MKKRKWLKNFMNDRIKEKQNIAIEKLKDPKFYLENFTKIQAKKAGKLQPFILNEAQKDLFNTVRKHNRVIILKARQIGFSTAMVGYYYHKTITTPGTNTAIIGYNSSLTAELLQKVKTFYNTTPPAIRPMNEYNSKYEMSFPKINSKIIVLPSTVNVGRGYTLHNVLATELSAWDDAAEKMATLEASVPINGSLVIESTPRGQGNEFHKKWFNEDNDYKKKQYGWEWGYTEEEIALIKKRMDNPIKFAQEYGLEFLSSGRSVFDQNVIKEQRKNILEVGDEVTLENGEKFIVYKDSDFIFYKPWINDHVYVCGVDTSEGVTGGDFSVAIIWDRKTGEEVAFFRKIIPPDVLGTIVNRVGRWYNNAHMAVEVNNHGLTTLKVLKDLVYPSLYFRPSKFDSTSTNFSDKLGWKTTKMTREIMLDDFAQYLRDDELTIHSKQLLNELSIMIYDDRGVARAESAFHDDTVFAASVGLQAFKVIYNGSLAQINYEDYLPLNLSF